MEKKEQKKTLKIYDVLAFLVSTANIQSNRKSCFLQTVRETERDRYYTQLQKRKRKKEMLLRHLDEPD